MPGRAALELVADPPHEHVDRAITPRLPPTPQLLQKLIPRHHPTPLQRQRIQKPKLRRRQLTTHTRHERLHITRIDPQLLDLDRLTTLLTLRPHTTPRSRPHPRHQLLHRKRLHQIIIRPDLQRMHPIMLRPPSRHHHDRRPDPLTPRRLDQPPPINPRQHQIEHTHIRPLEPQPSQPRLTLPHPQRIKTRRLQMTRHPLRNHLIILNDQHPGHPT